MPGGDRTGPAGYGPMSGRGMGYCAGYPNPGFTRGWGRGFGGGWGRGRGFGRGGGRGWRQVWGAGWNVPPADYGYAAPPGIVRNYPSRSETRSDLEAYREELRKELAGVEEALSEGNKKK